MNDQILRVSIFVLTLVSFTLLELKFEYRPRLLKRKDRWGANIGMVIFSSALLRLIAPLGLFYFCHMGQERSLGFFHLVDMNIFVEIIISLILLDFLIYLQHRLFHHFDFLWRFHRVHHADVDLDASSALRFHPLEILFSFLYKAVFILLFGFSFESVFFFEIILSSMAIFNHSNLYIPHKIERLLRLIFVTPQMHIIHHSVKQIQSDSNFGFNLSCWDRILKSYTDKFDQNSKIGQNYYRDRQSHRLLKLIGLPFKNENNLK